MRKLICFLLAICLFGVAGAMGEALPTRTTLTPYAELENASLIDHSDRLCVQTRDGCYLAAMDGTALTDPIYYRSMDCSYGYITASVVDGDVLVHGLLDADGATVMPFEYQDLKVLNKNWGLGVRLVKSTKDNYDYSAFIGDDVYLIDTVDIYWLPEGRKVVTLNRDHYSGSKAYGEVINIEDRGTGKTTCYDSSFIPLGEVRGLYSEDFAGGYTTVRENGQSKLADANGNIVFDQGFSSINTEVIDGYFVVYNGDKNGLGCIDGTLAVPAEYDQIQRSGYGPRSDGAYVYVTRGYAAVVRDGKLGYYEVGKGESCPPAIAKDLLNNAGMSASFTDMGGNLNILAADGEQSQLDAAITKVYPMECGEGLYYSVVDADYNRGMVDWHGAEVLPLAYDSIELSGSGRYLAAVKHGEDTTSIYEIETTFGETAAAPEDAPAAESEDAGSSALSARALLDSAVALVGTDAQTAAGLVANARDLLGEDSPAYAVLSSVLTLIDVDAEANASSIQTLLTTALGLVD
ncbi:MAG: hypothetical protein IJJ45_03620 [Clostridia bacterium]|nr:hypothetical protein [Clostridia bacterium]